MWRGPGTRRRLPERSAVFAYPGDLETPTGGYAYDRRMIAELRAMGWRIETLPLGQGFPDPAPDTLMAAYRLLAACFPGQPIIVDGLALGVMPDIARHLRADQPLVAMLHHPLALETGLSDDRAAALRRSERTALQAARRVVTNSRTTARMLQADFGVAAARLTVALPGTEAAPFAPLRRSGTLQLLSIGTLVPRKGHDLLISALAGLRQLDWRLTIIGDDTRDAATAAALRAAIAAAGLGERVTLAGAVPQAALRDHFLAADIFVLASRYEGFGMVYSEAVAHGLPVLGTRAGAIPEALPAEAGWLVEPDDAAALQSALARLLTEPETRLGLARQARQAAAHLPRWRDSAAIFAGALEGLLT